MKKTLLMLGLIFLTLIPLANAATSYYFKQNSLVNLKIFCFDDNDYYCDNSVLCSITILYPNSSVLVDNQAMNYNPSYYDYNISSDYTDTLGEYSTSVLCNSTNLTDYAIFTFTITPNGEPMEMASSILHIGIFAIFIIIGFILAYLSISFSPDHVFLKFLFLVMAFIFIIVPANLARSIIPSISAISALTILYNISVWALILFFMYYLIYFIFTSFKIKKEKEENWE